MSAVANTFFPILSDFSISEYTMNILGILAFVLGVLVFLDSMFLHQGH